MRDALFITTVGLIYAAVAFLSLQPPANPVVLATETPHPTSTATRLPTKTQTLTTTPTITQTSTQTLTPTVTPTNDINETRFTIEINGKRGVFTYGNHFVLPPACVWGDVVSAIIITQDGKIIKQNSFVTGVRVKGSTEYFPDCPDRAINFKP